LFSIPRFPKEEKHGSFLRKNTMEDTEAFLHKLGDPDQTMPIIHVAGTNGKGSVCAYMRSILEASGKRVCVFTSPHLVEVTERFYLCGEYVSKEAFVRAFLAVYEALDWQAIEAGRGYHPSFFEYLFFMAMLLFRDAAPDVCILETGLGGRLDATNSVEKKALCVVTSISLDHTEYLGDTVEKIAYEKAGIFRPGVPAVVIEGRKEVNDVFLETAKKQQISLQLVSKDLVHSVKKGNKTIDFCIATDYYGCIRIEILSPALYQVENCLLAVKAIECFDQGRTITKEQLMDGVRNCIWQGRMEEVLPDVFLDGAHNEDGVRAFLETVSKDSFAGQRSLLISVVKDKEFHHMFEKVANTGLFSKVVAAPLSNYRSLSGETLGQLLEETYGRTGVDTRVYPSVSEAFSSLMKEKAIGERIYVAGSLYLVGEVKAYLREHKYD